MNKKGNYNNYENVISIGIVLILGMPRNTDIEWTHCIGHVQRWCIKSGIVVIILVKSF